MSAGTGAVRRLLVIGDANADLVLRGDVVPRFGQAEQILDAADLVLGGSASIVACGAARLDVPTSLLARVGDDAFGAFVLDALRERGVDTADVRVRAEAATGLSVILSAPEDRSILTALGTIPDLSAEDAIERIRRWRGTAGILHVASYFLQPALAAGLPAVLAEARERGWTTSLDTNWDPAERWLGLAEALPHLDLLLPNRSELRAIAGALGVTDAPDEELARALSRRGPRVVVKDGARGGWSVRGEDAVERGPGRRVDVVDTTGAGDSFDAGYLAALAHGVGAERERLRWAAVAGSLSTTRSGGTAGQATRGELLAALTG
ncbi:carbohydrate kinase family protein [Microbacterium resistens]|uniref:Carbohydrate kinase family protein n=1 Tax=Microbacterium resistens TaxID=156977 RepID=A0ABY3RNM5_9MICO|nr:carbohydrate kinase family protein [Microbacterium resistens]UGS25227.1 carbohydrate kinase family protein [Microbacterium resistens]